jgi:hypothetical protein
VIKSVRACAIKTRRTNILELTISEQTQDCLSLSDPKLSKQPPGDYD